MTREAIPFSQPAPDYLIKKLACLGTVTELDHTIKIGETLFFLIAVRPGPRIVIIDMTEMNSRATLEPRKHKTRFEIIY